MKRLILTSILISLCFTCLLAAKHNSEIKVYVNGTTRKYVLYVPDNVTDNAPLVFSLHGAAGHDTDRSPFRTSVADSEGCIVVYPQGLDQFFPVFGGYIPGWNSTGTANEDLDFFKAIIDDVDSRYSIDRNRVYCCGFSNGGMMTYANTSAASDIFAAFASISGFQLNEFHLRTTGYRPVPFLHIHGKSDDFVKYSCMPIIRDGMVARNGCNPVPEVTTNDGKYTKSVYEAGEGGFPYVYYEIDGMGHSDFTTSTEDGNSALTMWKFMSQYTLEDPCDTTLKWRLNIDTPDFMPRKHNWKVNLASTRFEYGRQKKENNADNNVYPSLQFEAGHYVLNFGTTGDKKDKIYIQLTTLDGSEVLMHKKAYVGKEVSMTFSVPEYQEYKIIIEKESADDKFTYLEIHSADEDAIDKNCKNADEPDGLSISLHSENYDVYGEGTEITLALGSTVEGKIGVDYGRGIKEYDIYPSTFSGSGDGLTATYVTCTLTQKGNVDIYCYDDVEIDYFNGDGCGITSIDFAAPEAIEILSLRHNSLKALDLTEMCNAASIDVGDNPFTDSPLVIGANKPNLLILNVDIIENMDQSLSLTDYPQLVAFDAFDNKSLVSCDPSQCPNLAKLSIDDTPVSTLDVSHNPELLILNIGGTDIRSIDVTNNKKLQQLFCPSMGYIDQDQRISSIDISQCPDLIYFFCGNNALKEVDLTHNPELIDISLGNNYLTEIDLSNNDKLRNVSINNNYLNFATLPSDPGWLEYNYKQRPIELPLSYLAGTPIDLADMLLRPGTTTTATVYIINPDTPSDFREMPKEDYTFADGILTILTPVDGYVYAEFQNSELDAYPMTTTQFKVKSEEDYGKKELAFTMSVPSLDVASDLILSVGMEGASEIRPAHYYVDLGDGTLIEGIATTDTLPKTPNFVYPKTVYGDIKVYAEADGEITAFGIADEYIADIDLTKAKALKYLSIKNAGMYAIDLKYNNNLRSLTLTGNHFGDNFTLAGDNGSLNKNFLEYIDLSDNELTSIALMTPEIITYLDLSKNKLTGINLTDAEKLVTLNLSENDIDYLRLSYQSSLKHVDASHNRLTEIVLPETNVIESMDLGDNAFTFASLPVPGEGTGTDYRYSPQAQIAIAAKGIGCNLSAQYVIVNDHPTEYTWICEDGTALVAGTDYVVSDGITSFLTPAVGMTVHCDITNASFPDLTLTTAPMLVAGLPQYVIGEFTTVVGGQTASLSLGGSHLGSSVYIDWEGNGKLSEYLLKPTYTLYTAETTAGARVKVYSYEEVPELTIFSVNGITLDDVDLSGMTSLTCLSISNAGITELKMPEAPALSELYLDGNAITQFDFAPYTKVTSLSAEHNQLTSVDISALSDLQFVNFSSNKLKTVNFGELPDLWAIHLNDNEIEEIDMSGVPMAYQVTLDHNRLTHIDLDDLKELRVIYIDHNMFTFTTLPKPRAQWSVYVYSDQAPLDATVTDGKVDLSSQSEIDGVSSQYMWLKGQPWIDEETGELMGEMLVEGEEYTVEEGITTFYVSVPNAVCIILNELFPRTYLTTAELNIIVDGLTDMSLCDPVISVVGNSIEITAAADIPVSLYAVDGQLIANTRCDDAGRCTVKELKSGLYIVRIADKTAKVRIP